LAKEILSPGGALLAGMGDTILPDQPADDARSRLAAIADSSDDAIVGKDLSGVVTSWNKGAEAMFGYAAAEIVGQPITWIIPPDRIGEETDILARVRRGERLLHFETERRRKDGSTIPVSLTISPVRDAAGRVVGVSKIARDLTEMQHAQSELGRREALLRSILDTIPDALIVIDAGGLIQSFSRAAERLFGHPAADVLGRDVSMLMPPPYREAHHGYLAHHLATGERRIIGIGRIVVGQRRDGSTFPMELSVGAVSLTGEKLFTGFVRDLTERQDRERRLNELRSELAHVARLNELGQMASALAHEVNQPLTAIGNYIGGARRLLAAGHREGALQAIERIAEQSNRAAQIVQRLRSFVRKGNGERATEHLPTTIEEATALALVGVGHGIKLSMRFDPAAAEAVIDKVQIQQVLFNLMRNAVEAMAESPRRELTIATAAVGAMVEISVADTGPGLPETVRANLFQPFVTTKANGMGVGLSICRTIAEAHGGVLRADHTADGSAVFRLTVPRAAAGR
jgi:two-component system sensor kinase FixL